MKKLLQKALKVTSLFLIIIGLFSSKSSAQLGTGWNQLANNQEIQLESDNSTTGDNTDFTWPRTSAYINSTGGIVSSPGTSVVSSYGWNATTLTHTFTLNKAPGNRSEIRVQDNYSTGSRQLEGYFTMNDKLQEQAIMQLFGSSTGATQMQIRGYGNRNGGQLEINFDYGTSQDTSGSRIIAQGINNVEVKINVIHLQENVTNGNVVIIYVNNVEKFRFADNETVKGTETVVNNFKYGVYATIENSNTNLQTKWRDVKIFRDGAAPTALPIPTAPSNLTATAASSTSVNLSWNDNSNNESKFFIQYSQNGGAFTGIGAITPNNQNPAANTTSYTVTNLAPNTSYVFRIRSENTGGKSAYATSSTVTTPPAIVYYKIKVLNNPTFVLNSSSTTPVSGTNVNVFTSGTSESQLWQLIPTSNGYVRIVPKLNPNLVLAPISATLTNGVDVRLDTWASFNRQQWLITPLNNGTGASKIEARLNGTFVLDCSGTPENNRNVQIWTYAPNNRQQWIVEPVPGGGIASINQNGLIKLESFSPTSSKLSLNFYVSTNSLNSSIRYSVPEAGNISLELFDVSGQRIKVLDTGFKKPNTYNLDFNSTGLTKGIYLLKLSLNGEVKTEKIIVN